MQEAQAHRGQRRDANEGNDYQQLANVALEAKANLELTKTEVVADAGYYNAAEVGRCCV